jgi:hypothetical protein
MLTITEWTYSHVRYKEWVGTIGTRSYFGFVSLVQFDHINQWITLYQWSL